MKKSNNIKEKSIKEEAEKLKTISKIEQTYYERGITLVALVITVVILIILATVTINFLFGTDGLVTRAQEAAKLSNIESVREQLEMAKVSAIVDGLGSTTADDYFEILEAEGIIGNAESDVSDNNDGRYDVTTNDGFIFQIIPVPDKDNATDMEIEYVGDATGPRIRNITAETTTNSATITVDAINAQNGVFTYEYKKNGETDWQTVEGETGSTCTIEGLDENVIYNIRVTIIVSSGDNAGTATRETSIHTGEMPTGAITFEEETWQGDGTASVMVHSSQEGYTIQYQIVETDTITKPEELDAENWQTVRNGEAVTGIEHNETVYARLWDGYNGSSYASASIKDDTEPQAATIQLSENTTDTDSSITAIVTLTDNESGVNAQESRWVCNTTSGNIGTNESDYTGGSFTSNPQELTLSATTVGTYYLHVLTKDRAGNVVESVSDGVTVENAIYTDASLPTAPKVADGMIPVKYVEGTGWVRTTNKDKEWYDYGNKKWANVVLSEAQWLTNGSNQVLNESQPYSMLVWIPRYAYQITTNYHTNSSTGGNINIVFIDTNNQDKNKKTTYKETYPNATTGGGMDDYVVHPAFNFGTTKLSGFWVGKFETSHIGCTTDGSTGHTNTNVTTLTPMIKAGVTSWRRIEVSNIHAVCTNLNNNSRYGLSSNDNIVDPHMMKNSEWGAVAYLSQNTNYGKGKEVWVNNNTSYITGRAGNSVDEDGRNYGTAGSYTYTTSNGQQASTTGNVTGVYDMSGMSTYVAAYVNTSGYFDLSGSYLITLIEANERYIDEYRSATTSGNTDTIAIDYSYTKPTIGLEKPTALTGHYGDAIWETSNSYNGDSSWYGDSSHFPNANIVFFVRGGNYAGNGIYSFSSKFGDTTFSDDSFRIVIPVLQ